MSVGFLLPKGPWAVPACTVPPCLAELDQVHLPSLDQRDSEFLGSVSNLRSLYILSVKAGEILCVCVCVQRMSVHVGYVHICVL